MIAVLCSVEGCRCQVAQIRADHLEIVVRHHGERHLVRIPLAQLRVDESVQAL